MVNKSFRNLSLAGLRRSEEYMLTDVLEKQDISSGSYDNWLRRVAKEGVTFKPY
jgi:hypothetical protein